METRNPAVAGMFYPGTRQALSAELDRLIPEKSVKRKAIGIVSPHAGYIYSGAVAGELISSVAIPQKIILIGPNHTGFGIKGSVMAEGCWSLPNGTVNVDTFLAKKIMGATKILGHDTLAHLREHSLEVQIPFLLHEREGIDIVPITLMGLGVDACREAGHAIAGAIRESGEEALIIASSDMTHYESDESARKKDKKAIDKVLALDPEGLYQVVTENRISMCGIIPATVMLFAALELGAKKAELVKYATSGDVSGEYNQVVGYAGMIVE
ncbi:MAG: AmmeMemoRadiSam system protein B [Deltaproteobacteria bacterium]|nr:AmmeMemoRadiSam system protein B [Deltaproteobacteria bacterium]